MMYDFEPTQIDNDIDTHEDIEDIFSADDAAEAWAWATDDVADVRFS